MEIEELIKILENISSGKTVDGWRPDINYKTLQELGLIHEDYILSDPFYDEEAIDFAIRCLKKTNCRGV